MDCERTLDRDMSRYNMGAPPNWDFSEKAILCFDKILQEEGLIGTYFIVPETAAAHRELWADIRQRGGELGLHLHPQGFRDFRWNRYFGDYNKVHQSQLLNAAAMAWEKAMVFKPRIFRPGNFSGDASVFSTLLAAGFIGGSVSLPGRRHSGMFAEWHDFGTHCRYIPEDVKRACAFLEVPVSSVPTRIDDGSSFRDPLHLRLESKSMSEQLFREVIIYNLTSPLPNDSLPRTIMVMTHNTNDFSRPWQERRLRSIIHIIRSCAGNQNLRMMNTTIEQLWRNGCEECADG